MALDGGGQRQHLALGQLVAQQRIGAQDARHDTGGTGTQAPGHGDIVALGDAKAPHGNAQLVVHHPRRAIDQVVGAGRHMGAVHRGNLDAAALLEGEYIVHRDRQAQRVKARAHVGARRRNRYLYHMRAPSLS